VRVFVTGADGFVGSTLVAQFVATGRPFVAVGRRPPADSTKFRHVEVGDLATASDATLDALVAGAAAIVHLAGRAHVLRDRAPDPGALYHAANVVATERMAAAAVRAGVRRFVFASTIKVHGEETLPGRRFRAGDPLHPQDAYARSKAHAEQALATLAAGSSLEAIIVRFPLAYGPRVKGNFLTLLDAVARCARMPFGRIANRRDLLYVGNLVHAITGLLDAPGSVGGAWLAADGEAVSTAELVRRIASALEVPPRVMNVPAPLLSLAGLALGRSALLRRTMASLEVDASPLVRRIGPPSFTLDQGLAATIAWWRLRHSI
jgi:nucleoside-diphosphate-sugar epimerase